jgi:hypothetical protein
VTAYENGRCIFWKYLCSNTVRDNRTFLTMSTTELDSPPEAKKIRLEEDRNSNDQDDLAIVSEISTPVTDSHGIQSGNNVLKNENTESTAVTEEDVGIFQYISPSIPGFTGIIKERCVSLIRA